MMMIDACGVNRETMYLGIHIKCTLHWMDISLESIRKGMGKAASMFKPGVYLGFCVTSRTESLRIASRVCISRSEFEKGC